MRLVIISHTAHFRNQEGLIAGWGPTVREIDYLASLFNSVIHVAPFHEGKAPESSIPYTSKKVVFVPLRPAGGKGLWNKLNIITSMPANLRVMSRVVRKANWVHLRLPTSLGLYALPLLSGKQRPPRWIKYAGNWIQKDPPLSYRLQRYWLIRNWQHSFVTINGKWPRQKRHLLSFENPCLTEAERSVAAEVAARKNFAGKKTLCFVGVLEPGKGILQLVQAMSQLKEPGGIEKLIIVGDGSLMESAGDLARNSPVPVEFKGYLPRGGINSIYDESHALILASDSEGFPKVIAEAAAFGCIPIATAVSSIGQYVVNDKTGFLLDSNDPATIASSIDRLSMAGEKLKSISSNAVAMASLFTYERYVERIRDEILFPNKD